MDGQRFDRITRRLATGTTRRAALGALVGSVFGLAWRPESADARRSNRNRRNRRTRRVPCRRYLGEPCSARARCCGPYTCGNNGNPLTGRTCCSQDGLPCRTSNDCCGRLLCRPGDNICV